MILSRTTTTAIDEDMNQSPMVYEVTGQPQDDQNDGDCVGIG
jgi:hypothetical protein